MISKEHRFHGLGSLNFVFRKGATVRGQNLGLRYNLNSKRGTYRLAIVVSRKVNKSAVVRNRIRRRVYEHVRSIDAKITKPYDLVITIFSDNTADLDYGKLTQSINELFKKAEII